MQDRFRFRAWVKESTEEYFTYFDVFDIANIEDNENIIVQQCTGLKDKNGKLIYENDIVLSNCIQWIIKYCDKCKSFQCFDNTYDCYACEGDYNWYDFLEDLDKTTVIGNIYENPELLEKDFIKEDAKA